MLWVLIESPQRGDSNEYPQYIPRAIAVRTHKVYEGFDQKSDIQPHWMAAHACLKNEFTENEKYHNLIRWLISWL